tara:strand:+ start:63943 stop:64110 length:168 start_codon:yes stop_codon:yes gene_type:complete
MIWKKEESFCLTALNHQTVSLLLNIFYKLMKTEEKSLMQIKFFETSNSNFLKKNS